MAKLEDKNLTQLSLLNKYKKILKYSSGQIKEDFEKTTPKTYIVYGVNQSRFDKSIETTKTISLIFAFSLFVLAEVQGILFSIGNVPISDRPLEFIALTAIIVALMALIIDEINKLIGISKYQNNALEYLKENNPELFNKIKNTKCKRKLTI